MATKHKLVSIFSNGTEQDALTVRWCIICGGIVIDGDYDGRTNPGQYMKMRIPDLVIGCDERKE